MKRWLIALFLCIGIGAVAGADAATVKGGSGLTLSRSGATATGGVGPSATPGNDFSRLMGGTYNPNMVDGAAEFSRLLDMPFKLKDLVPDKATLKAVITPANIAKGLRGGLAAYAAGEALELLMKEACVRGMGGSLQMSPTGGFQECVPGSGQAAPQSDGFEYNMDPTNLPWVKSKQGAADAFLAYMNANRATFGPYNFVFEGFEGTNDVAIGKYFYGYPQTPENKASTSYYGIGKRAGCAVGAYILPDGSCSATQPPTDVQWRDVTPQAADEKLEEAIRKPANADKVSNALKDALDKGAEFPIENPTITGPASSQTSSQTTQQTGADGSTSTTTTTSQLQYTYNGPSMTVRETTSNVTRNAEGTVTGSSSSSGPPSSGGEDSIEDSPIPPVPDLYVRKYPDGMEGIWNTYKDQFKGTPLFQLQQKLMPNLGDSGTCPVWMLNLDLATWAAYGSHDVAPPCWIWDVARAILILSALLLARALIFGG